MGEVTKGHGRSEDLFIVELLYPTRIGHVGK